MKANVKISLLVSIQIALIIASFVTLSFLENQQNSLENSLRVLDETRNLTDKLIFEMDRLSVDIPYADPHVLILEIRHHFDKIKNGGKVHETILSPMSEKFLPLSDVAEDKVGTYLAHVEQAVAEGTLRIDFSDPAFLELDTEKFDANGSIDFLISEINAESQRLSDTIILLEIGLAIINVGIHIFMIILILDILKIESSKNVKVEKLAIIGELAARLAHDLRNPLNVIRGAIRLLDAQNTSTDEKTKQRYLMVNRAINRMTHLLDDVLDFVRTKKPNLQETSVLSILKSSLGRVSIPKDVFIKLPSKDLKVVLDPIQFEIVFVNLISNAVYAVGEKGNVEIRFKESDNSIIFEIQDSGPGISKDLADQIFEPLVTDKEVGTGLGLSSCKNIVEQHGGTITASNNPTVFSIVVPKN